MGKIYQKEWHGIESKSFSASDVSNISSQEFYDSFIISSLITLDDLDPLWVDCKIKIARKL